MANVNSVITCPQPLPAPRLKLICFPYAGGGGHVFHDWSRVFPPEIEVHLAHYPGRGGRLREPLCTSFEALVAEMLDATRTVVGNVPFALFGHSLGGIVAYEVARSLLPEGRVPQRLIVSASPSPKMRHERKPIYHLPDDQFLEELIRMGGMDQMILENPELLQIVMPIVRADLTLAEDYACPEHPQIPVDILALAGNRDHACPPEHVRGWSEVTTTGFEFLPIEGDHLFIREQLLPIGQRLKSILCRVEIP